MIQQTIESPFLKDMPEYAFDRDKLTMVFKNTIGDCIAESLLTDIVYSGKEFNHVGDFRIWTEEEETYILHLPSGTIVGWYKFIHIGRCNFCNKPDMGINDLRDFFMLLRNQLLEESDLPSDECDPQKQPTNIDPKASMRKLQLNSIYGIGGTDLESMCPKSEDPEAHKMKDDIVTDSESIEHMNSAVFDLRNNND